MTKKIFLNLFRENYFPEIDFLMTYYWLFISCVLILLLSSILLERFPRTVRALPILFVAPLFYFTVIYFERSISMYLTFIYHGTVFVIWVFTCLIIASSFPPEGVGLKKGFATFNYTRICTLFVYILAWFFIWDCLLHFESQIFLVKVWNYFDFGQSIGLKDGLFDFWCFLFERSCHKTTLTIFFYGFVGLLIILFKIFKK